MPTHPSGFLQGDLTAAIVRNPLVLPPHATVRTAIAALGNLQCQEEAAPAADVLSELHRAARSSCVVVMAGKQVVGLFTTGDGVRLWAQQCPPNRPLGEVMTAVGLTQPEAELTDVCATLALMGQHRLRHLPLVDEDGNLTGIMTTESLMAVALPGEPTAALRVKAAQEELVLEIATQIRNSLDLATILETTVTEVRRVLGCDRVIIYQFTPGGTGAVMAESVLEADHAILGQGIYAPCISPEGWETYRQGEVRVIDDCQTADLTPEHLAMLNQAEIRSKLVMPIVLEGELWGLMVASHRHQARDWQASEVELLQMLSVQVAIALKQALGHQQLQQQLAERQRTETALQESEHRFRAIFDVMPDLLVRIDGNGYCHEVLSHHHPLEIPVAHGGRRGYHLTQVLPPELAERQIQVIREALATHQVQTYEHQIQVGDDLQEEEIRVVRYSDTEALVMIRDISDRKRSEAALRQSEAHQRALISALPDLLVRLNAEGFYLEFAASPIFPVLGNLRELVGTHVTESLPPEAAHERLEAIQRALATRTIQFYEQDLSTADHIQIEEVRIVPYKDDEVLALVRDISSRKQAEQQILELNQSLERKVEERTAALVKSEAQVRAMVAAIPDLLLRVTRDGRCLSSLCSNKHGSHFVPTIREHLSECLTPDLLHQQLQAVDRAIATGELQVYEHQLQRGNRLVHEEVRITGLNADEALIIVRDITERKLAEQALTESRQFVETVIQTAPLPLFWKDRNSVFLGCNHLFAKFLGLASPAAIVGKTDFDLSPTEAEAQAYQADDRQVMATGQSKIAIEETLTLPDGQVIWLETYKSPLRDWRGTVIGMVGMFQDISKRKQAEQIMRQQNEELLRATRLKDEFLATMSHELRTPLNAILGLTEGLQEQVFGEVNPQQRNSLDTIESSASHLLDLINDILDVAKIESGQMELDLAPTAIAPLCQASLSFVKQQARARDIQLELHIPLNLPDLLIDQRRMRQVLINLLTNAVKFTPEGGRVVLAVSQEIRPDPAETQPLARFAISDTGIGIAPEHIPKLFKPFIQIDSALNRRYQGTGLGLVLVKRIVEQHGGQVSLTSEVGMGSCFTVDLPCPRDVLALSQQGAVVSECLETAATETPQNQVAPSPLILLAEDQEANIVTLASYLGAKGYRMAVAHNGQEALTLALTQPPDLILMDIQMPGMDGLTAIQKIRQEPTLAPIPIIAMTALAMEGDRERCLAAGATDYLSKPVRLKQLAATIQQLLTEARDPREWDPAGPGARSETRPDR